MVKTILSYSLVQREGTVSEPKVNAHSERTRAKSEYCLGLLCLRQCITITMTMCDNNIDITNKSHIIVKWVF